VLVVGIQLEEFEKWLAMKAKADRGGAWQYFINNPEIINMAYAHSSKYMTDQSTEQKRIVEIGDFRTLLVNLFVVSILYTHFKRADSCSDCGDAFNNMLSILEFKLAVRTFCQVYGEQEVSDQQILADFQMLDVDKSGSITFEEVKNFILSHIFD